MTMTFRKWLKKNKDVTTVKYDEYLIDREFYNNLRWQWFKKDFFYKMYDLPLFLCLLLVVPIISLFIVALIFTYIIAKIGLLKFMEIYIDNPLILLFGGYVMMLIPVVVLLFSFFIINIYAKGCEKDKSLKKELTDDDDDN